MDYDVGRRMVRTVPAVTATASEYNATNCEILTGYCFMLSGGFVRLLPDRRSTSLDVHLFCLILIIRPFVSINGRDVICRCYLYDISTLQKFPLPSHIG